MNVRVAKHIQIDERKDQTFNKVYSTQQVYHSELKER